MAGTALTKLLLFMVMTSSMASTLTTILPTARTTLSMAAFKAAPNIFAKIHPRYLTPTWSTWGMGAASVAFYVILTTVSGNVLNDSIGSLGLMIAFYYGLTGFACFWFYRNVPLTSRQVDVAPGRAAARRDPAAGAVRLRAPASTSIPTTGTRRSRFPGYQHARSAVCSRWASACCCWASC